jgi:hypothetical protein
LGDRLTTFTTLETQYSIDLPKVKPEGDGLDTDSDFWKDAPEISDFDLARIYAHKNLDGDRTCQSWSLSRIMRHLAIEQFTQIAADPKRREKVAYKKWADEVRKSPPIDINDLL